MKGLHPFYKLLMKSVRVSYDDSAVAHAFKHLYCIITSSRDQTSASCCFLRRASLVSFVCQTQREKAANRLYHWSRLWQTRDQLMRVCSQTNRGSVLGADVLASLLLMEKDDGQPCFTANGRIYDTSCKFELCVMLNYTTQIMSYVKI